MLTGIGTVSVAAGVVGIFVPVLPTTPFLLLASACYASSSKRYHAWLHSNRVFGRYLTSYEEGRGLPLSFKVGTVLLLWLTIGATTLLFVTSSVLRIMLVGIAGAVTAHVATLRTCQ